MPAAAVIPAPIAYIKVVAVKKLVVGFLAEAGRSVPQELRRLRLYHPSSWRSRLVNSKRLWGQPFTD